MKKIILNLEKDRLVYLFVLLGIILIIFPTQISVAVPYILGTASIVYGIATVIISIKYPDAATRLGDGIVTGAVGVVFLLLKAESISAIGIIWAILTLHEVAEEIDDFRETKTVNLVGVISICISMALALLLLIDPFKNFSTHVRILGLEIIASAFVRRRRMKNIQ